MQVMQSRVVPMEDGKDLGVVTTSRTTPSKPMLIRLLQLFVVFLAFWVTFPVISIYTIRHFGISNVMSSITSVASSVQPCFGEATGLDGWIRAPSNLMHTMNDKELLWRASLTSRRKEYPFKRVPKIAFMFLTKGPLPLALI